MSITFSHIYVSVILHYIYPGRRNFIFQTLFCIGCIWNSCNFTQPGGEKSKRYRKQRGSGIKKERINVYKVGKSYIYVISSYVNIDRQISH